MQIYSSIHPLLQGVSKQADKCQSSTGYKPYKDSGFSWAVSNTLVLSGLHKLFLFRHQDMLQTFVGSPPHITDGFYT